MRSSQSAFRLGRRIWLRCGAVAVAAAGAVAFFSAPSQASSTPPPRDVSALVRVYYVNDKAQSLGEHFITACPGQPLMKDWGIQTGTSYLIELPCTTPVPPPADPS